MSKKNQLKVTFLGTGTSTGVPMIGSNHPVSLSDNPKDKRLRSSIMVSYNGKNYIVDCGGDFRQQMLREDVKSIEAIFFTHEHADHIAGLDDIRGYYFKQGKIPIYTSERVLSVLQKRYDYIFASQNRYPGAPEVISIIISEKSDLFFDDLQVTPIGVMHGDLPILGYRFNDIAYLTDVKSVKEQEQIKLQNLDILIITGLRFEPHPTHFNIEEALNFINLIKPKKAYLTHISEFLGFHDEVEKQLPDHVFLAYDGLTI